MAYPLKGNIDHVDRWKGDTILLDAGNLLSTIAFGQTLKSINY